MSTKCQDQEDNPFSVDEIEPRLYLGNCAAARNIKFLISQRISHILTVDSFPIPNYVCSSASVVNKYVHIADMARENILEYFEECISFIEEALKDPETTNGVLVHCFYGVSRSSTIVIAYLMKKYEISYRKAFEKAKSKRKLVQPNNGFAQQLKLFHRMGYKIDSSNKNYKTFRLKLASEMMKSCRILPSSFMNLFAPDPGLIQERPDPLVYRCRKCRRVVASKSNLITHLPSDQEISLDSPLPRRKENPTLVKQISKDETGQSSIDSVDELTEKVMITALSEKSLAARSQEPQVCMKMFFVEPIIWMKDVVQSNFEGKLYCPSCKSKIGCFNWTMASKCPCGKQISPSFYLVPSKIEYSNIVQNIIQVTV